MRSPGGRRGRPAFNRLGVAFMPLIVAPKIPVSTRQAPLTRIIFGATIITRVGPVTQRKTPAAAETTVGAKTIRLVARLPLQASF
jgi:hypothetical protein